MKYRANFVIVPLLGKKILERREFESLSDMEAKSKISSIQTDLLKEVNKNTNPAWSSGLYLQSLVRVDQPELVTSIDVEEIAA